MVPTPETLPTFSLQQPIRNEPAVEIGYDLVEPSILNTRRESERQTLSQDEANSAAQMSHDNLDQHEPKMVPQSSTIAPVNVEASTANSVTTVLQYFHGNSLADKIPSPSPDVSPSISAKVIDRTPKLEPLENKKLDAVGYTLFKDPAPAFVPASTNSQQNTNSLNTASGTIKLATGRPMISSLHTATTDPSTNAFLNQSLASFGSVEVKLPVKSTFEQSAPSMARSILPNNSAPLPTPAVQKSAQPSIPAASVSQESHPSPAIATPAKLTHKETPPSVSRAPAPTIKRYTGAGIFGLADEEDVRSTAKPGSSTISVGDMTASLIDPSAPKSNSGSIGPTIEELRASPTPAKDIVAFVMSSKMQTRCRKDITKIKRKLERDEEPVEVGMAWLLEALQTILRGKELKVDDKLMLDPIAEFYWELVILKDEAIETYDKLATACEEFGTMVGFLREVREMFRDQE